MLQGWSKRISPSHWIIVLFLLGILNGLTFVFLVPPWQHYDEPSHFEYAWLLANHPGLPKVGDFDPKMRRQVAVSMLEHGFYRDLGFTPSVEGVAAGIGYTQLDDPPLYYLLASLPLRLIQDQDITRQMYAARLVSLCMYLAVILIGWGFMGELVAVSHPLRWMVPISLALLPGFVDLMTSISNNVGAVLVFSLFLWASVRLVRRGLSFFGLVFVFGATALCYWTANMAWLALPLLPIVVLLSWLHGRWRAFVWISFSVAVGIGLVSVFTWGDAALWYRRTFQSASTRVINPLAPVGTHAFELNLSSYDGNTISIQQPLAGEAISDLKNTPLTIGAWVWSSQPMRVLMPALSCDCGGQLQVFTREVQSGTEPRFYSLTVTLPANATFTWVALMPPANLENVKGIVFFDGLLLLKGEWSAQNPPIFKDTYGTGGIWGNRPFINLLRNPSAEQAGPGIRTWANKLGAKLLPTWPISLPSDIPVSLLDWKGAGWYYQQTFPSLFRTFWAKFGWGNVPLLGSKPYLSLAIVTLFGVIGTGWAVWKRRQTLLWELLLLLGLALLGIWVPVIFRGVGSLFGWYYIPVARYSYPAILPTILILSAGWLETLRLLAKWSRMKPIVQYATFILFLFVLDTLSILSIFQFYYVA